MNVSSTGDMSVTVSKGGGSSTVEFETNHDWTVEMVNTRAEEWCSVSPMSGQKGRAVLTVNTSPNETYDERHASFNLKSGGLSKTIAVNQKQKDALLVSSNRLEVPCDGELVTIEVMHNINYEWKIDPSCIEWIKHVETKSLTTNKLVFSISDNPYTSPRNGAITFSSGEGAEVVKIYQEGFKPAIVISDKLIQISSDESTFKIEVKNNVDVTCEIEEGNPWLEELITKAMSTNTFTFHAKANDSYDQRTGQITVSSKENGLSETVSVIQMQKDAIVIAQNEYSFGKSEQLLDIKVMANVQISSVQTSEWIHHKVSTKGLTERKYSFLIQENTTGAERTGYISFSNGVLTQRVKVSQGAFNYGLLQSLECYTNLDRESITEINFIANSEKTTDKYTQDKGCYPVYGETNGTVVNIYTRGERFMLRYGLYYFENCKSVQKLDLRSFNTDDCTNMYGMFRFCSSLKDLDISSFKTGNVRQMCQMFLDCSSLENLDLSGFDTSSNTTFHTMFSGCTSLKSVDVSGFNTSKSKNFYHTFSDCESLETLDITNFDTSGSSNFSHMFYNCKSLKEIDVSHMNTSAADNFQGMFCNCESLEKLDLSHFDTSNASMLSLFLSGCTNLRSVDLSSFNTSKVTDFYGMFLDCLSLESVDVSRFDTSNASNFVYMFCGCEKLKSLDVSGFDTSNATKLYGMFGNCRSLETIDVSGFKTDNVTSLYFMFGADCFGDKMALKTIDVSNFNTSNVTDMGWMFQNCAELESLDLSNFDTRKVTDVEYMFRECYKLENLDISNFDLSSVENYNGMLWWTGVDSENGFKVKCSSKTKGDILSHGAHLPDIGIVWDLADWEHDENYVSTDYSQDGVVKLLQGASQGKGINLVITGDVYSDRQLVAGEFDSDVSDAVEAFFSEEPYRSFRHLFNIYQVNAVSAHELVGESTAFNTYFGSGTGIGGDNSKVIDYVLKAVPEECLDQTVVAVIVNVPRYAGTAYLYYSSAGSSDCGDGLGIAYVPLCSSTIVFSEIFCHETGGHAFAKLADEYVESPEAIPAELAERYASETERYGFWKNVDYTSDPSAVRWNKYITDSRYASQEIGVYEGGLTYRYGVWSPTSYSIMRSNKGGFNAPSREAIYYRIHKLAYGEQWQYDHEEFVSWDLRATASGTKAGAGICEPSSWAHTAAPVVVKGSWESEYDSSRTK